MAIEKCHYCSRFIFRSGSAQGIANPFCVATFDHVEPKSMNGLLGVAACAECNGLKGSTPYEVFTLFVAQDRSTGVARRMRYTNFLRGLLMDGLAARGKAFAPAPPEEAMIRREDFLVRFRRAGPERVLVATTEALDAPLI